MCTCVVVLGKGSRFHNHRQMSIGINQMVGYMYSWLADHYAGAILIMW